MRDREQLLDTITNLFFRELKLRYSGYLLGPMWIILYPLTFTLLSSMVFSLILKNYEDGIPYFLFVMTGFIHWIFFNQSIQNGTKSLVANRILLINNKFPTESLIISAVLIKAVDYIINLFVIFIFLLILHIRIHPLSLLFMSIILPCQIIIQYSISLITAMLNVYYRDTQNIIEILLQLAFYATPIIYPIKIVPMEFQWIIAINPVAQLITAMRQALFYQTIDIQILISLYIFSLFLFAVAHLIYKRLEPSFADHI